MVVSYIPPSLINYLGMYALANLCIQDASKTADKAEFWKAYTTSLMYQNSEYMHHTLGDSFIDWHVWRLQNHLWLVSTQNAFEIVPQADTFEKLKGFIRSVMVLAHDLQCQRGVYEFDHTVQLGDRYDESKMHDVKLTDMEDFEKDGKVAIVSCILSKGWVRKVYSGSVDIDACICKARVTVTVEDSRI